MLLRSIHDRNPNGGLRHAGEHGLTRQVTIETGEGSVTGRWRVPEGSARTGVLLAHGAGAGQDHRGIVTIAEALVEQGHPVLTFNYPYVEAGRRFPDRQETLLRCHRAAAAWLERRCERIVMAGRSMGGRMASYLAVEGQPCAGLVLYAYPLHPAGKPDRLRADHLPRVPVPMLFFTGRKDRLALPHLVEEHLMRLGRAVVEIIPDADHSFRVPKRSGTTERDVLRGMAERTARWIEGLG